MTALGAAEARMRAAGVSEVGIRAFARLYGLLVAGDRGIVGSDELEPVRDVPSLEELGDTAAPVGALVMIRLNGGLATTMGL
jgi:hypothetical protein